VSHVFYQRVAKADLINVWLFIAEDNVAAADAYIARLQHACVLIAASPLMGVNRPDIAKGVSRFAVDDHVIYYELDNENISVLRVWHAARDPASLEL
jgi:toxin ParE1/3/4